MPVVVTLSGDIWIHIVRGATEEGQLLISCGFDAETEINDLDSVAVRGIY